MLHTIYWRLLLVFSNLLFFRENNSSNTPPPSSQCLSHFLKMNWWLIWKPDVTVSSSRPALGHTSCVTIELELHLSSLPLLVSLVIPCGFTYLLSASPCLSLTVCSLSCLSVLLCVLYFLFSREYSCLLCLLHLSLTLHSRGLLQSGFLPLTSHWLTGERCLSCLQDSVKGFSSLSSVLKLSHHKSELWLSLTSFVPFPNILIKLLILSPTSSSSCSTFQQHHDPRPLCTPFILD